MVSICRIFSSLVNVLHAKLQNNLQCCSFLRQKKQKKSPAGFAGDYHYVLFCLFEQVGRQCWHGTILGAYEGGYFDSFFVGFLDWFAFDDAGTE